MVEKRINRIKLAIVTQCNLNCDYCFVKKTNEYMNFSTAKNSVNLLLKSQGKDKLLSIYGGEPLFNFELIEKISPYAISQAKKLKKNLIITVCTNAVLLEEKHLDFLKKHDIKLIISLVGGKSDQDKFRNLEKNKGTYEIIFKKLPMIFEKIPRKNLGVGFCLFPSTVIRMERNFKHLLKLGFNHMSFEMIQQYEEWSKEAQEKFVSSFNKIIDFIFINIQKENFIFLNPVNWEIKHQKISQSLRIECPFWYNLEVYPSGAMAFSPFLLNSPDKEKYIIGNVNSGFLGRFKKCKYNSKNHNCQMCQLNYSSDYHNADKKAERVYGICRNLCLKAAEKIKLNALNNNSFDRYIRKIKKEICF